MRRVLSVLIAVLVMSSLLAVMAAVAGAQRGDGDSIMWYQAKRHLGEQLSVRGTVKAAIYEKRVSGHPTFLNIGRDFPSTQRFTVVVWEKYRARFPFRPEVRYRGKTLIVSGHIRQYQGVANIFVRSPKAIEIVE